MYCLPVKFTAELGLAHLILLNKLLYISCFLETVRNSGSSYAIERGLIKAVLGRTIFWIGERGDNISSPFKIIGSLFSD